MCIIYMFFSPQDITYTGLVTDTAHGSIGTKNKLVGNVWPGPELLQQHCTVHPSWEIFSPGPLRPGRCCSLHGHLHGVQPVTLSTSNLPKIWLSCHKLASGGKTAW